MSRGNQWAWPSSTWGSQRPRGDSGEAPALEMAPQAQFHRQVGMVPRAQGAPPEGGGGGISHSPSHSQGHHHIFGSVSRACSGRPLQAAHLGLFCPFCSGDGSRLRAAEAGRNDSVTGPLLQPAPKVVLVGAERVGEGRPNRTGRWATRQVSPSIRRRPPFAAAIGLGARWRAEDSFRERGQVTDRRHHPDRGPLPLPGIQFKVQGGAAADACLQQPGRRPAAATTVATRL